MKKLIFIVVASLFLVQVSDAQIFKYGIKAGVGFSSVKISDVTGLSSGGDVYDLVTGDGVMGYHLGLQTRIKIAMLYVQPEIYWNAGGGTVDQVVKDGDRDALNVKFNRIDVPLLVGVKLGPLRLNVGPVGSYVISETNDFADINPDYHVYTDNMTWGWQGGIGVGLSKLTIDLRYEGSLSDLSETITLPDAVSDFTMDPRPKQWILSVGFWL